MNIYKILIKLGKNIFDSFIVPIIVLFYKFFYRSSDKKTELPKCKSNLLLQPAHILAEKIRLKQVNI